MSKEELTPKQKQLVKARKASRVVACLLIFGGAMLILVGLSQNALQTIMNGIVLAASSSLLFVVSKLAEKRLNLPSN